LIGIGEEDQGSGAEEGKRIFRRSVWGVGGIVEEGCALGGIALGGGIVSSKTWVGRGSSSIITGTSAVPSLTGGEE